MPDKEIPTWCSWHKAEGPLLLVAPHGGRCAPPTPESMGRRWRVNDLHTAALTVELARRLNASFIVNTALDRNDLDLNRISAVSRRAPWLLMLFESLLEDLLQRHDRIQILFLHGWNVIQPKCDIGIGAALEGSADFEPQRDVLTVSPDYLCSRLELFRAACGEHKVQVTYGERYPASHPNNLLQLFRRDRAENASKLAHWASAQRIEAVQLELAVPLRWPGPIRDEFLTSTVRAFSHPAFAPPQRTVSEKIADPASHSAPTPPASLAFFDPRAGIGLISGVSMTADRRLSGRLLVFDDSGRVALFTGEDEPRRGRVLSGPLFTSLTEGFRLRFDGSLLDVDDGALYLRLEDAFARSELIQAKLELDYRSLDSAGHGRVTGSLCLASREVRIECYAFAQSPLLQRVSENAAVRVAFAASFGADSSINVRVSTAEPAGRIDVSGPPDRPSRLDLRLEDERLVTAFPVNGILIRRPVAPNVFEIVNLGVARFSLEEKEGAGLFEYARRLEVDRLPSTPSERNRRSS